MDAHQVVPEGVKRDHVNVVLYLLAEGVGQPREAAHVHSHAQAVALNMRRADGFPVRVSRDDNLPRAPALAWASPSCHGVCRRRFRRRS